MNSLTLVPTKELAEELARRSIATIFAHHISLDDVPEGLKAQLPSGGAMSKTGAATMMVGESGKIATMLVDMIRTVSERLEGVEAGKMCLSLQAIALKMQYDQDVFSFMARLAEGPQVISEPGPENRKSEGG